MNKINEIQLKYNAIASVHKRVKITNSKDAYKAFQDSWDKDLLELQEEFKVLLLNRANHVLGIYNMSKGGTTGTLVDVKLLLVVAIKSAAHGIIMAHNHPSGNLNPSDMDKQLYSKIKKAAKYMDISVLDNLIITKESYFSFTDEGI